jgi:hypothetical protein
VTTIDSVSWADLKHAYGDASDVPALLRRLGSDDAGDREGALYDLYGTIWHQGSVYSATAAAVPFLVQQALADRYPDRARVVKLLADVCEGYGDDSPAVRAAAVAEAQSLIPLLRDADPETRTQTLRLVAASGWRGARQAAAAATGDPDPSVRAVAWIYAGRLDTEYLPDAIDEDHQTVMLSWALARAGQGDTAITAALAGLLADDEAVAELHAWTPTGTTPLEQCEPLLGADGGYALFNELCRLIVAERRPEFAAGLARLLLRAEFSPDPTGPLTREDLGPAQGMVVHAIGDSDAAWEHPALKEDLEEYGLRFRGRRDAFRLTFWERQDEDDDEPAEEPVREQAYEPPSCVLYPELSEELRITLDVFVETLEAAGWSEVRQSYTSARQLGEAGVAMTPLATARRFGGVVDAEVGFHVDAAVSAVPAGSTVEEQTGYLWLTLVEHDGSAYRLRATWDDPRRLFGALAGMDLGRPVLEGLPPVARSGRFEVVV